VLLLSWMQIALKAQPHPVTHQYSLDDVAAWIGENTTSA
jgi:hypothetical protein